MKIWQHRAAGLPFGARFYSNMTDQNVRSLDNLSRFFSFLSLCLCRPCLHVRRNDANTRKHKHNRMEIVPFTVLVRVLPSLRRACKPRRRKHKHKRKHERLMLASHRFTRRFHVRRLLIILKLASNVQTRPYATIVQAIKDIRMTKRWFDLGHKRK